MGILWGLRVEERSVLWGLKVGEKEASEGDYGGWEGDLFFSKKNIPKILDIRIK